MFLPVIIKYGDTLATGRSVWKLWMSYLSILLVFGAVFAVGFPDDREGDFPWTIQVSLAFIVIAVLFMLVVIVLFPLLMSNRLVRVQQWGVLITPDLARQKTQDKRKTAINTRLQAAKWRKDAVTSVTNYTKQKARAARRGVAGATRRPAPNAKTADSSSAALLP